MPQDYSQYPVTMSCHNPFPKLDGMAGWLVDGLLMTRGGWLLAGKLPSNLVIILAFIRNPALTAPCPIPCTIPTAPSHYPMPPAPCQKQKRANLPAPSCQQISSAKQTYSINKYYSLKRSSTSTYELTLLFLFFLIIGITIAAIILFVISQQPYAAVYLMIFMIIKIL